MYSTWDKEDRLHPQVIEKHVRNCCVRLAPWRLSDLTAISPIASPLPRSDGNLEITCSGTCRLLADTAGFFFDQVRVQSNGTWSSQDRLSDYAPL